MPSAKRVLLVDDDEMLRSSLAEQFAEGGVYEPIEAGTYAMAVAMTGGNVNDIVLAYEKKGKNGARYVMKPPSYVVQMKDLEFKSAKFPPGHQPAF